MLKRNFHINVNGKFGTSCLVTLYRCMQLLYNRFLVHKSCQPTTHLHVPGRQPRHPLEDDGAEGPGVGEEGRPLAAHHDLGRLGGDSIRKISARVLS